MVVEPTALSSPSDPYQASHAEVLLFARNQAGLAIELLRGFGFPHPEQFPARLTPQMWREVSAWMQLTAWYLVGLGPFLPAELPAPSEAGRSLVDRMLTAPGGFEEAGGTPLFDAVLATWLVSFARGGPSVMSANFLIEAHDEDAVVDAMAEFLWRNRNLAKSACTMLGECA